MNRTTTRNVTITVLVNRCHEHISGRVLDAGCGAQPYKRLYHHEGQFRPPVTDWVGLDIRPVGQLQADVSSTGQPDASFDTVLCTDVLQYLHDPFAAVCEFSRLLKPKGKLIVVAPNCSSDDGSSFFAFKAMGLGMLAERAGLKVLDVAAGGDNFREEFTCFRSAQKWGIPVPGELIGFIGSLDENYPLMSVLVAEKE